MADEDELEAAHDILVAFASGLTPGVHSYRDLKNQYDRLCQQAGIDVISDQRAGRWLIDAGLLKSRRGSRRTVTYEVPLRGMRKGSRRGSRLP